MNSNLPPKKNKDEKSPRVMVSGGKIFSNLEYERLADFKITDIQNVLEDWEANAPEEYKNLLNAE
jgi:hypothetical protein